MKRGIYTLANDVVYDQLVALLNSIQQNSGHIPVCVIAYNNQIERVSAEIAKRDNVSLLNDPELFKFWEAFSLRVWQTHPTAIKQWKASGVKTQFYRVGENHRYVSFDPAAPFEEFIYLDADTLVMQPLDFMFERLAQADMVVYDFQFKDLSHIFNVNSDKLTTVFSEERLQRDIFCSGCYASKRGLFSKAELDHVVDTLGQGNSEVLYMGAPNQSLLNYMVQINNHSVHNVALEWRDQGKATGNAVSSKHFVEKEGLVYDHGNLLTYLHFIGLSSKIFRRVCSGENLDFPYRKTFLHYRYLHEPVPKFDGKLRAYNQPPSLQKRLMKKIGLA